MPANRKLSLSPATACAAILLATLVAYSNSFSLGFALDWAPILQDARIRELTLANLQDIFRHTYFWPHGEAGIYRPLTTLSWLFNYTLLANGENALGYHVVNWLLHSCNALLVFALARRLSKDLKLSLAAAGLWALHPVLTEAVSNVGGRADLLAAAAVLGGFLLYLNARHAEGPRRIRLLTALAAVAAAGACAKESAVVLPAVFVLYELCHWRAARLRPLLGACVATGVPIAAFLILRAWVLATSLPAEFPFVDNPIAEAPFLPGRLTALGVLARYLWLTVWPATLSADYSYPQIPLATPAPLDWLIAAIVPCGLIAALFALRRRPILAFLAGAAFLAILPASNLLVTTGTIMAERLLYLPSVALVALLALAVHKLPPRIAPALLAVVALTFGVRTWLRNPDWRDDYAVAAAGVVSSPASFKPHRLLADYLLKTSPSPSNIARMVAEADLAVHALESLPDELAIVAPWNVAGAAHIVRGDMCNKGGCGDPAFDPHPDYQRAADLATRSTRIETAARARWNRRHNANNPPAPMAAEAFRILATADLRLARPTPALEAAQRARDLDPSNPEAYAAIANADAALGRGEEAAIALIEGMSVTSDNGLRDNLLALYKSGVDPQGCAIIAGPRGPALNPSCAIVRRNFCAAAAHVHRDDILRQFECAKLP